MFLRPVSPLLLLFYLFGKAISVETDEILQVHSNSTSITSFCVAYIPTNFTMPDSKETAIWFPLVDLTPWDACAPINTVNVTAKVVMVKRYNCSYRTKADTLQQMGASGVIVATLGKPQHITSPPLIIPNTTIHISIALLIKWQTIQKLRKVAAQTNATIRQYMEPQKRSMDHSLILIMIVAITTLGIGSYWNGQNHYSMVVKHRLQRSRKHRFSRGDSARSSSSQVDSSIWVKYMTILMVFALVMCMCIMLLLIYFFYAYIVYVIIFLFFIASAGAMFSIVNSGLKKIPVWTCNCPLSVFKIDTQIQVREVILAIMCLALSTFWVVVRNEPYGWVFQDILGAAFCINTLQMVRLPSLLICTLLMGLLFIYDIFFVFITPFITPSGDSVMVSVAKGVGSHEMIPMVFRIPHIGIWPATSLCHIWSYSMLGFGDVLIPGFLVSYVHGFGLEVGCTPKPLYFICTMIGYSVGMAITCGGILLMRMAQPALLYLVPCTLLPVFIIALIRREFKAIWSGESVISTISTREEVEPINVEGVPESNSSQDQSSASTVITSLSSDSSISNHRRLVDNNIGFAQP